jgi:hypothetical protein
MVQNSLNEILSKVLEIDPNKITDDMSPETVEAWDSFNGLMIVTEFEKFPILFSPIAYKKTIINIAYNFETSLNACFLTKADGDQDRPNRV